MPLVESKQSAPAASRVGLKIQKNLTNPTEIQDIAYLLAVGRISQEEATELYDQLLKSGQDSVVRQLLKEFFPSLGL